MPTLISGVYFQNQLLELSHASHQPVENVGAEDEMMRQILLGQVFDIGKEFCLKYRRSHIKDMILHVKWVNQLCVSLWHENLTIQYTQCTVKLRPN